ncbi:MAG: hypothetical protein K0S71_151 [Clostridia bacterium]|jgi:hypothetical protein|nr:hypothetical protein [Clostridia bacterium]
MEPRVNKERFEWAKERVLQGSQKQIGIGTLKEGTLHAVLKYYMEPDESMHEAKNRGFVADIMRPGEMIEIQTRAFAKLSKKLSCFLAYGKVTVVYPVSYTKWVSWINLETGEVSQKRKSPKKGTPYEIFFELYRIKEFLLHPNLSLCIMLINIEEYKLLNGWSYDKKRGAHRKDRVPIEIIDEITIQSINDYAKLIPDTLEKEFTAKDFKEHTRLSLRNAQTALNILTYVNAIERIGKKGRAYLYKKGD